MENKKYLTVSALNKYLAYKIDTDINLKSFIIQGEISNARFSKGHLYFVLKDDDSEISAIMFSNYASNLAFKVEDGIKVLCKCSLQLYQKKGTYSLQVTNMREDGLGVLYQNFLLLKEKLSKEGLFDTKYKKPIPEYSENIGLITSNTGDAMHDVVSTISKRYPIAKVYLYPALVQGSDAPASLISALRKANSDNLVDVIIIARGGGSIEDLSCFNDEMLAREIFNSKIPIISGVGHEADFTICDFVSDDRAPTPTGAAVRATKDKNIIIQECASSVTRLKNLYSSILEKKINEYKLLVNKHHFKNFDLVLNDKYQGLINLEKILKLNSPLNKINQSLEELKYLNERIDKYNIIGKLENKYNEIIDLSNNINNSYNNYLNKIEEKIDYCIEKMILLNPLNLMKKGYSLSYQNNKLITDVNEINSDLPLVTRLNNGEIESKIIKVKKV